jgi:hypothetical protein
VGPIRNQAREVLELLEAHDRCRVQLVTLPEETPVNETIETAQRLRERIDVALGPVTVNGLIGPLGEGPLRADAIAALGQEVGVAVEPGPAAALAGAARFRRARHALQEEQVGRLAGAVEGPLLHLPFVFSANFGPPELEVLVDKLDAQLPGGNGS